MGDWDSDDLQADLNDITSPTYGGEAFRYAGGATTYYGVFGQTDLRFGFSPVGHSEDDVNGLVFTRGSITPAVNVTIYRIAEAATYRIISRKFDLAAWEVSLEKPR